MSERKGTCICWTCQQTTELNQGGMISEVLSGQVQSLKAQLADKELAYARNVADYVGEIEKLKAQLTDLGESLSMEIDECDRLREQQSKQAQRIILLESLNKQAESRINELNKETAEQFEQLAEKDRYANELKLALKISQKSCNEKDARISMLKNKFGPIGRGEHIYDIRTIEMVVRNALQATPADVAKWASEQKEAHGIIHSCESHHIPKQGCSDCFTNEQKVKKSDDV